MAILERSALLMPGATRQRMTSAQQAWIAERLDGVRIGIGGATGAVGREALALLDEAGIPRTNIIASGSSRSVGTGIPYADGIVKVAPVEKLQDADGVLLATPAAVSTHLAPALARHGVLVSDNSSALRASVPLVIPEINGIQITPDTTIMASPNCTTTIVLTAANRICREYGLSSIEIVSYQAVSGAGLKAMNALIAESADAISARDVQARWLSEPVAFNVFPHESAIDPDSGLCAEEQKFIKEAASILGTHDLTAAATCMRVPTLRTHSVAVRLETTLPCTRDAAIEAIRTSDGVELVHAGPTSNAATGRCNVFTGRPVVSASDHSDGSIVRVVVAGDQLLKGAAWNALQNLALLVHRSRQRSIRRSGMPYRSTAHNR